MGKSRALKIKLEDFLPLPMVDLVKSQKHKLSVKCWSTADTELLCYEDSQFMLPY